MASASPPLPVGSVAGSLGAAPKVVGCSLAQPSLAMPSTVPHGSAALRNCWSPAHVMRVRISEFRVRNFVFTSDCELWQREASSLSLGIALDRSQSIHLASRRFLVSVRLTYGGVSTAPLTFTLMLGSWGAEERHGGPCHGRRRVTFSGRAGSSRVAGGWEALTPRFPPPHHVSPCSA